VNARIIDRAGSMYFVFYEPNASFPSGLNSADTEQTRSVMQLVATQAPISNGLLFDWLTSIYGTSVTPQRSFIGSDTGSDVPRIVDGDNALCDFRDESMDVDM